VAEHHQRFIGFDRLLELAPAIQRQSSRMLATAVRFLEIVDELPLNDVDAVPQPAVALYSAAVQHGREAVRGEWDVKITGQLLTALGFELEYDERADVSIEDPRRSQLLNGSRRLDPANQAVPDPNLFLAQVRESRYVRTTDS